MNNQTFHKETEFSLEQISLHKEKEIKISNVQTSSMQLPNIDYICSDGQSYLFTLELHPHKN